MVGLICLYQVWEGPLVSNSAEGRFEDVTELAGVGGDVDGWSKPSAFFDADNDGDLDLFVGHYVQWSPKIDFEQGTTLTGIRRAYGQPMNFRELFQASIKIRVMEHSRTSPANAGSKSKILPQKFQLPSRWVWPQSTQW